SWEDILWAFLKCMHDRMCALAVHMYNKKRALDSTLYSGSSPQQLAAEEEYLRKSAQVGALTERRAFEHLSSHNHSQHIFYQIQRAMILGPEELKGAIGKHLLPAVLSSQNTR